METVDIHKIINQNVPYQPKITEPQIPAKNPKDIYKILFFIFLGLFIVNTISFITYIITQNSNSNFTPTPTSLIPTKTISPTSTPIPTIIENKPELINYTNPIYKYSLQFPNNWAMKTSTVGEITLINSENYYNVNCYRTINAYSLATTQKDTSIKSLYAYITTQRTAISFLNKTSINDLTTYEAEIKGMGDGTKAFFIENPNSSFCVITLANRELTDAENKFINSFTFN